MFKKITAGFVSLLSSLIPLFLFAQVTTGVSGPDVGYITNLLKEASKILQKIVVLLIAFAIVWFIFNVIRYAMSEDDKSKSKDQMIWGIIAIAVCISIWGLVAILQRIFLGSSGASITIPGGSSGIQDMIPLVQEF